ncbi:Lrp/AsnC family transcriptional regulator [Ramlibacter algicola]|uniref:Lrp/AsnC family transcriptional regulator n=1 Tax=Ramlibacter algicola TaxID=2795217 RepID=A0A934URD7_9BURK|nr:Lrp/AsnC family transcriptional regulator [Ramlibacter algicola]MBK0392422.1 Lrp/AsnC family transcriptional regulator [Ramlibacter algicola]
MNDLDRHDVLLLAELQRDSRQTVQQLAAAVGLSSTPCWKRVKELEAAGIIQGYTALVDRERVGLSLCVLAEVNLTRHNEDDVRRFEQAVAAEPAIVSCYATTGQADYVIKVLVPDIKRYESFLHDTMFKLPGVTHVRSSVVLKEVKSESRLPLAVPRGKQPARRARRPAGD